MFWSGIGTSLVWGREVSLRRTSSPAVDGAEDVFKIPDKKTFLPSEKNEWWARKGSSENKDERRMIMNVYLMPLFIIIHTVYCFIMLHSLFLRAIITNFIAIMALWTLDLSCSADCDEDDESLRYLRGIRILRSSELLFAEDNAVSSVASLFFIALGGLSPGTKAKIRRHPLECFSVDHPIVLPINPWNIKTKLSGISPISMIYDFPLSRIKNSLRMNFLDRFIQVNYHQIVAMNHR